MAFDLKEISRRVRALGTEISPQSIQGTAAVYAPFHELEPYTSVKVTRDATYGANERHRLDVFCPDPAPGGSRPLPVVMFVHGGGFVAGDKRMPGSPYSDNVALWAVRRGLIGVNITYRLAPQFPWPAGGEDAAAAVAWVRKNIAEYGGDPHRIFLMGTSAGAAHTASYITHRALRPPSGLGLAGAMLFSGLYNLMQVPRNPFQLAYYGNDDEQYRQASTLEGLIATDVPLLFVLTEMDPPEFQQQGLELLSAWVARHGRWPNFVHLLGHNHLSTAMHLNTPDGYLGDRLLDFIDRSTAG
jgi:acetyl esterase/lipase